MKKLILTLFFVLIAVVPGYAGLVGFEGEYALPDDDRPVSVIALFEHGPVAVQMREANLFLPFAAAARNVEAAHALFRAELSALFGVLARMSPTYEITHEFRHALNGVALTMPANKVSHLPGFESVRMVLPDINIPVPEIYEPQEIAVMQADRNPLGMRVGRASMRADEMHALGYRGEGMLIAVIDTGIYWRHAAFAGAFPTLAQMQARNPAVTAEDAIDGIFYGRNFHRTNPAASNDPGESGRNEHGTHVAGVIAGRDTGGVNSILGVAPMAHIIVYSVTGTGGTPMRAFLDAIEETRYDRPDVVNISMGIPQNNDPANILAVAVNNMMIAQPQMTFVIASGNDAGNRTVGSPGTSSMAITAGNATVTPQGDGFAISLTPGSSRGPLHTTFEIKPDIMAQGAGVHSTLPPLSSATGYGIRGGTSQAAPHVAGAAALLKQFSRENFGSSWRAAEIKARMMNTAINVPPGAVNNTGAGYIDVFAAAHTDTVVSVEFDRVPTVAGSTNTLATARTGSFSFGGITNLDTNISRTMRAFIANRGATTRTYTLSHRFTRNPGGGFLNLQQSVIVQPGRESAFEAEFSVWPYHAAPGFYEGYVYVSNRGAVVARLPFSYVVDGPVVAGHTCECPNCLACPDCGNHPCECCPVCGEYACDCFGPVPPTGVTNATAPMLAMFAFAALSAGLWGVWLREKRR